MRAVAPDPRGPPTIASGDMTPPPSPVRRGAPGASRGSGHLVPALYFPPAVWTIVDSLSDIVAEVASGSGRLGRMRPASRPRRELRRAEQGFADDVAILHEILRRGDVPDVASAAARLLEEFGDVGSIVAASSKRLSRACGADRAAAEAVAWFAGTMRQVLRSRLASGPILADSTSLLQYLACTMAHLGTEQVRALFLTAGNRLIADEVVAYGGTAEVSLGNRHLVTRALEVGAGALVLVHNHPSGDPTPSSADVARTQLLSDLCVRLDIRLNDHLVVASGGISSMRAIGAIS